jgi:hypothetical protein
LSADSDIIEFGRFRLHRRDRVLWADGQKLDLGTRAVELLLALIDAGGAVVTKDELLDRVWSGVIVEENNLHVQISTLRVRSVPMPTWSGWCPVTGIGSPLARQDARFGFGHVQPTAVFGRVVPLETLDQPTRRGGGEGLV